MYLLIFLLLMFTYSHARSTYTPSKETGFCFLPFSSQNQASKLCRGGPIPPFPNADTMGAHSSRDSSPTSPRSDRASVRLVWVLNVYILADYVYCPFTFIFFTDSDFIIVKHYLNFPFSPPPLNEMSQWRFLG